MARDMRKLVIVGHGAAGLAAALSAAEEARRRGLRIDIALLEKASEQEAGGNTRFSPSNIRMDAPDRLAVRFEEDMQLASGGQADRAYFRALAENAVAMIGWLETHGIAFARLLPQRRPNAYPAGRRRRCDRREAVGRGKSGRGEHSL